MGTLADNEGPDEMPQKAAFHQGLHFLMRLKQFSGTEMHHNLEIQTYGPLNIQWTILSLLHLYVWENPTEYKGLINSLT